MKVNFQCKAIKEGLPPGHMSVRFNSFRILVWNGWKMSFVAKLMDQFVHPVWITLSSELHFSQSRFDKELHSYRTLTNKGEKKGKFAIPTTSPKQQQSPH